MISFSALYRNCGLRLIEHMTSPQLEEIAEFQWPLNSKYNYISDSGDVGPPLNTFPLSHAAKVKYVEHVYEMGDHFGKFRIDQNYLAFQPMIKAYHRGKPDCLLSNNILNVKAQPNLAIKSYAGVMLRYRYVDTPFSRYDKWRNRWITILNDLNKEMLESDRNQFLFLDPLTVSVSREKMDSVMGNYDFFQKAPRLPDLKKLGNEDNWFFFQFWLWLGNERTKSMLSLIDRANYPKLNFVFRTGRYFTMLNLEYLDSFIQTGDEDNEAIKDPVKMRKRFMAYASTINNVVEVDVTDLSPADAEEKIVEAKQGLTTVIVRNSKSPVVNGKRYKVISSAGRKGEFSDLAEDENGNGNGEEVQFKKDAKEDAKSKKSMLDDEAELEKLLEETEEIMDKMQPDEIGAADEETLEEATENEVDLQQLLEIDPEDQFIPIVERPEDGIMYRAQQLLQNKQLTPAEYRRFERLSTKYQEIEAPEFVSESMGKKNISVADAIVIDPEELKFEKRKFKNPGSVIDESMLEASVEEFKRQYTKKLLHRNILAEIIGLQKSGIVVHDIKAKEVNNILTQHIEYSVQVQPVGGSIGTFTFKVHKVDDEGIIVHGGVNYYLKTQRGDMPIRKISPRRVALTSHNGKLFIDRLENVSTNYGVWLSNHIVKAGIDPEDTRVTHMQGGNVFDNLYKASIPYTSIAQRILSFEMKTPVGIVVFNFDHIEMEKKCRPEDLKRYAADNVNPCGFQKGNDNIVVMDKNGFMAVDSAQGFKKIGSLEELMQLDSSRAPLEVAIMTIFGDKLPLGVVLMYHIGLKKLLKVLGTKARVVPAKKIIRRGANEFVIRFADYALIISRTDALSSLVLGSINLYKKYLKDMKLSQMENREYVVSLVEKAGLRGTLLDEADIIWDRFIDSVTKDLLISMGEPTNMLELYRRAAELLLTDEHPNEIDGTLTRYIGYERIASAVSLELTKSCRDLKRGQLGSKRGRFSMKPEAVYMTIMMDSAKEQTNETNPVQDLKQNEVVTFSGRGGRSGETMVKKTRVYPKTDEGVISEAGVDSGNVGVISYFSPNANINSLYGTVTHVPATEAKPSQLLSTSSLLAPFIEHDDAKRIVFCGVQQTHTIATKGARVSSVRTGYEAAMINRVSKKFGSVADQDGKIKAIENDVIQVQYKDGSVKAFPVGEQITKGPGTYYSNKVVTDLKAGQTIKQGDVITYNEDFFEKDWFNPGGVVWRSGVKANIIFLDSLETYEDGSVISERIAEQLVASVAEPRSVTLDFDQIPARMLKVGDHVEYDSILCTIQEPVMAGKLKIDAETLRGLEKVSQDNPKAKFYGRIQDIEVFYNGDIKDMNPDLQKVVMKYDNARRARLVSLGKPAVTGKVDYSFKINGNPLAKNQLVFNFYITHDVGMDVGDKLVYGNQMKSTVSRVLTGVNQMASGEPIDGFFSYRGDMNRIVNSLKLWGTTSKVLEVGTNRFVDIAMGKDVPDF